MTLPTSELHGLSQRKNPPLYCEDGFCSPNTRLPALPTTEVTSPFSSFSSSSSSFFSSSSSSSSSSCAYSSCAYSSCAYSSCAYSSCSYSCCSSSSSSCCCCCCCCSCCCSCWCDCNHEWFKVTANTYSFQLSGKILHYPSFLDPAHVLFLSGCFVESFQKTERPQGMNLGCSRYSQMI